MKRDCAYCHHRCIIRAWRGKRVKKAYVIHEHEQHMLEIHSLVWNCYGNIMRRRRIDSCFPVYYRNGSMIIYHIYCSDLATKQQKCIVISAFMLEATYPRIRRRFYRFCFVTNCDYYSSLLHTHISFSKYAEFSSDMKNFQSNNIKLHYKNYYIKFYTLTGGILV